MAVDLKQLREAIPPHCFRPSYWKSFFYLGRDIFFVVVLIWAVFVASEVNGFWLRFILLQTCSFALGLVVTAIWVIAHECGHGSHE